MPNQVPEEIKHKRFDRLKELVESQIEENNQKYVGTIQKVLVEGPSKKNTHNKASFSENKIVPLARPNAEGNLNTISNLHLQLHV